MVWAAPQASLLAECYVVPPPSVMDLQQALQRYPQITDPWEARFLLMVEKFTAQTQELGNCNTQLAALKEWAERQAALEKQHERRRSTH